VTTSAAVAPTFSAWRIRLMPSTVLFDPAPAITGMRPATAATTSSITF
jgi:hypothetical protein